MKQSRSASFTEAVLNTLAGFGISLLAQWFFLPLLGVAISLHQNFIFALIMTVISIARTFILRRVFEFLHIRAPMTPAMLAVIAERRRQIEQEGWTIEHDDSHLAGELARAGGTYAMYAGEREAGFQTMALIDWPWSPQWWKPKDFRRDLVRAGALILAEIERFDRMRKRKPAKPIDLTALRRHAEIARGLPESPGARVIATPDQQPLRSPETNTASPK